MLCGIHSGRVRETDGDLFGSEHRGACTITARDGRRYGRNRNGAAIATENGRGERLTCGASLRGHRSFALAAKDCRTIIPVFVRIREPDDRLRSARW